jgi:hypothetical protein
MDEKTDNRKVQAEGDAIRTNYRKSFEFLRENFAVLSALAIVAGIALSTFFLFSYLSSFSWRLIWFVQYVDVLSFGIVAVGIIGGAILALNPYFYMWFNTKRMEPRSRKLYTIGLAVLVLLLLGLEIWGSVRQHEGYFHILSGVTLAGGVVLMIFAGLSHVQARTWPNSIQAASLAILVVILAFGLGKWMADLVLDTTVFDLNVTIKEQVINDAKLVIVLSRYTVLLKDNELRVVPTADIGEFHSAHKLMIVP